MTDPVHGVGVSGGRGEETPKKGSGLVRSSPSWDLSVGWRSWTGSEGIVKPKDHSCSGQKVWLEPRETGVV